MKKLLKSIVNRSTGLMTKSDFESLAQMERRASQADIPPTLLQQRHIDNLKMLPDREAMLNRFPKDAVCAEIGVNRGEFSERILSVTRPKKLHLVDAWAEARYHDGLRTHVSSTFEKEIAKGLVELNHGYSTEVIPQFADNYFDWVYLDTGHDYALTIRELNFLKNKIKPGGIIAGHDYLQGNWEKTIRYGVMEAVHEFCSKENWQIIFLTINLPESPSFAITSI